jgi:hypothetical protein
MATKQNTWTYHSQFGFQFGELFITFKDFTPYTFKSVLLPFTMNLGRKLVAQSAALSHVCRQLYTIIAVLRDPFGDLLGFGNAVLGYVGHG